ncbi:Beta-barrel assembly machine subunit BamA [Sediminibacterium ginsengisoli]|uniref:Beta-barrel assembly machine subunit BamA n=1 Tax=Sediminibacterium ginsengisoli TaxID=413434 RepID=A0A1T4M4D9_9BACT|nr:Beta-barrel assembly machine subunit BamA [Sediminibacterium ginsengisoli]
MQKVYKILVLALVTSLVSSSAWSQQTTSEPDTVITSIDADLLNIFNQKTPKKYKVAAVKVTGNRFFDENLLISIANINVGDELTIPGGDNFSKAITKLWGQNYFSDVEIYITKLQGKDIEIEIAVTERARLSTYHFTGVKKGEAEDLQGKTGLVPNRVVTENMKISAVEAIKKFYAEKGFRDSRVTVIEKLDTTRDNNTISLNFIVEKGSKVKINNINFGGNTVDAGKLKKQLKDTKEKSRFTLHPTFDKGQIVPVKRYTFNEYLKEYGYLIPAKTKKILDPYVRLKLSSAKFDEKKYEQDKENLLEYYNSMGYRDAMIEQDTVYHTEKGDLNIDIKMNEGNKYYFGNITWRGNTKYSDSQLTLILGIRKGDIYNLELLNKKLGKSASPDGGDISGLYQDDGYLFFRTDPVETAVYRDTIDYEIRIIEGPQATIKNIRISGNDRTKEHVIRREIRTIPGDKFSRQMLVRSQREIAQLNYFNQEKIGITPVPNPDDGTVDINYSVEEKSSDQLELSAGWGGAIGLTGTLGVTFNNFSIRNIWKKSAWDPLPMGDGQKLSVRVQSNGKAFRSYNFSFTEPWLGGKKRNALTFSIFNTKYGQTYDPTTGAYDPDVANTRYISTTGATLSLAKQLKWPDDYFSLSMGINYTRYKLSNYAIDPTNLPGFDNGIVNNLNFRVALQRSSVDQPLFPRSGSTFLLSLQVTPPYSLIDKNIGSKENPYNWIEYHKWRFNGEWYVPLGKPHGEDRNKQFVLKTSAKFGFLGRFNPDLQISPFERFQVGDAGLSNQFALLGYDIIAHRGYPVYDNSNPKVNPDKQNASQYFTIFNKYSMELRYPLSLNPSSTIFALGFFEAANGWYSMKDYNPFQLRRSVGLGMRFFLPMFGLLGFDYGIGLDRFTPGSALKDAARFTFMLGFEPE